MTGSLGLYVGRDYYFAIGVWVLQPVGSGSRIYVWTILVDMRGWMLVLFGQWLDTLSSSRCSLYHVYIPL